MLPNTLAYTLEISFFNNVSSGVVSGPTLGSGKGPQSAEQRDTVNTDEGYLEMGRQLALSFLDFYQLPRE